MYTKEIMINDFPFQYFTFWYRTLVVTMQDMDKNWKKKKHVTVSVSVQEFKNLRTCVAGVLVTSREFFMST